MSSFTLAMLYLSIISVSISSTMALPIPLPHFSVPTPPMWNPQRTTTNAWLEATLKDEHAHVVRRDIPVLVEVKVQQTKRKTKPKQLGVVAVPSPGIQCAVM